MTASPIGGGRATATGTRVGTAATVAGRPIRPAEASAADVPATGSRLASRESVGHEHRTVARPAATGIEHRSGTLGGQRGDPARLSGGRVIGKLRVEIAGDETLPVQVVAKAPDVRVLGVTAPVGMAGVVTVPVGTVREVPDLVGTALDVMALAEAARRSSVRDAGRETRLVAEEPHGTARRATVHEVAAPGSTGRVGMAPTVTGRPRIGHAVAHPVTGAPVPDLARVRETPGGPSRTAMEPGGFPVRRAPRGTTIRCCRTTWSLPTSTAVPVPS